MQDPLEKVKTIIQSKLPNSQVFVEDMTGTKDHLDILVVDDVFKGKMLIEQHQIVMDILKESLSDFVHAVKIKTMDTTKFENLKGASHE